MKNEKPFNDKIDLSKIKNIIYNAMTSFLADTSEIEDAVIYHKTEFKERRNHYAFYSVNTPIQGYDTDRESFIGLYNGFKMDLVLLCHV